jgi:Domain of unknown function (DUF4440)
MKHCPTCNRTFTDPNLSFCIDDGTPLKVEELSYDPDATLVSPSQSGGSAASPQAGGSAGAPSDWKGPAYQPPPGQFAPGPTAKKGKVWLWVLGIVALLLLGMIGLGVVAAIVVPRMMRAAQNENANRYSFNSNTPANENSNRSADENANSNSSTANENANSNANSNLNSNTKSSQPPTDKELVLSDLKNLEDEWTAANLNADKKKLARILADDYVSTLNDGTMQGKADYLRDIKPDATVKHWEFDDLKLTLKGDRATLKGTVRLERDGQGDDQTLRFTDKFVWRDERWQAVGSEVSAVE